MIAIAFELQQRIDHVLEHFGPGEIAFFGDMADEPATKGLRPNALIGILPPPFRTTPPRGAYERMIERAV